jgi:choline kinase
MKAVILAAGRGSRLGRLTTKRPKPLTQLAGKSLLEWQMSAMRKAGIEHITIIGGYNASLLTQYGDAQIVNPYWNSSNMVRTLLCADKLLSTEPLLVSYGDIVYRPDIVTTLLQTSHDLAISFDEQWYSLWSERFDDPLSDAETFAHQQGQLFEIGKKAVNIEQINGQYMGLLYFTPQSWTKIKGYLNTQTQQAIDKLDMTSLLQSLLEYGIKIGVEPIKGGWVEVDNPSDIELYEQKINQNNWHHDWR